MRLNLK